MTKEEALKILEKMTDKEFDGFLKNLPNRVHLLLKAGFVDWKKVLPQWYLKLNKK